MWYLKRQTNGLERPAIASDSLVVENAEGSSGIPSRAVHVKRCLNRPGPPGKAKYSLATDSELVPRGKGEKHPFEGNEIVPATVCLQCVGARSNPSDSLPFA